MDELPTPNRSCAKKSKKAWRRSDSIGLKARWRRTPLLYMQHKSKYRLYEFAVKSAPKTKADWETARIAARHYRELQQRNLSKYFGKVARWTRLKIHQWASRFLYLIPFYTSGTWEKGVGPTFKILPVYTDLETSFESSTSECLLSKNKTTLEVPCTNESSERCRFF